MECVGVHNGSKLQTIRWRGIKRKLDVDDVGLLQLDVAAAVPDPAAGRCGLTSHSHSPAPTPSAPLLLEDSADPFMNNMDEISYWICTKRAPCLMGLDNSVKVKCDNYPAAGEREKSIELTVSPEKKRKLSILDEKSECKEKIQNVYFEQSQHQRTLPISCKSPSLDSDIDFNIRKSSIQEKCKKLKINKNSRTTLHKKNIVVTSTPKTTALRRSLRKTQSSLNNNSLNVSFDILNSSLKCNGISKPIEKNSSVKRNKCFNNDNKNQFDDLSDVSGFTANYIRSTRTVRNKRGTKASRNLMKKSKTPQHNSMMVCHNTATNTKTDNPALNYSTASSNVLNLVSISMNNVKPNIMKKNQSTSLLKFIDVKKSNRDNGNEHGDSSKVDLNISTQSPHTSRYPKRHNRSGLESSTFVSDGLSSFRKLNNHLAKYDSRSSRPAERSKIRTRSGRQCAGASLLVLSNATDAMSSDLTLNVASTNYVSGVIKNDNSLRPTRGKCMKSSSCDKKKGLSDKREQGRNKSGFAACFSDSDDDSGLAKQRRFFC